jgi:cytochrome c-type biogenesis protein CcmH
MTYLAMAALAALTLLWLSRPLWQGFSSHAARRAANVAAYEGRLAEIANEQASGLMAEAEAQTLKQELAVRLLTDASTLVADDASARKTPPAKPLLAAVFVLACSGLAAAWYWQAGSWELAAKVALAPAAPAPAPAPAAQAAESNSSVPTDPEVEAMVSKLATRLQEQPNNPDGWAMLGRSYAVMQRHADAAAAYAKANDLVQQDPNPEWLTGEGEALGLSRNRDLLGRPAQLFEAALAIDPRYDKALWYAALAAEQVGDNNKAAGYFKQLLAGDLPEEIRSVVQERLGALDPAALASLPAAAPEPAAAVAAPTATPNAAVINGPRLTIEVAIGPELAQKIPANAVLFVFAKAANGPPMPLAVQRLPGAPKLPITVTLDDSMGMLPNLKLSQFTAWTITARYSASGNVTAAAGDLEGSAQANATDAAQPIRVTIDRRVR